MSILLNHDGTIDFTEQFIEQTEADEWFTFCLEQIDWREEQIRIAGRQILAPRRVCWYGDPDAHYRYSGINHAPKPWPLRLYELKTRIERASDHAFNSVLCNLYLDGQHSMGWHSDDEKELGINPVIASLSLGAERRFDLRHSATGEILHLPLAHGSLLIMGGSFQHHWKHRIPKQPGITSPRINLTFRMIRTRQPNPM